MRERGGNTTRRVNVDQGAYLKKKEESREN